MLSSLFHWRDERRRPESTSADAKHAIRQQGVSGVVDLQIVAAVVQLNGVDPPDAARCVRIELDASGKRRAVAGLLHGKKSAAAGARAYKLTARAGDAAVVIRGYDRNRYDGPVVAEY